MTDLVGLGHSWTIADGADGLHLIRRHRANTIKQGKAMRPKRHFPGRGGSFFEAPKIDSPQTSKTCVKKLSEPTLNQEIFDDRPA